jgi:predicted nucleotidyltransferase
MLAKPRKKTGRALYYRHLPPDIPMSAIRRFARRIAERFDPEQIIRFGSFAYGTPHEESDVDLLVVMPCYDEVNQSIRISLAFAPVFPLDLIVRTPKHWRRRLADGDCFLQEITIKGILLFEKIYTHAFSGRHVPDADGAVVAAISQPASVTGSAVPKR